MNVSPQRLAALATQTGFRADLLEKVLRLYELLEGLRDHPALAGHLVLKGGSALNLFVFDLPRLSIDIDLNYIGATGRDDMLATRASVEQAVHAVCRHQSLTVHRQPTEHAGGKWRISYPSALGQRGRLELDLNFLLRQPLWPITPAASRSIGPYRATDIPLLDVHELAAGKLAALLSRYASRDLFDAHQLLTQLQLDPLKLRLAFVVYGGASRKDWRTVSVQDVALDLDELRSRLLPLLPAVDAKLDVERWASSLRDECRDRLDQVLPFEAHERDFLDQLLDQGAVVPELLTDDAELAERIRNSPALAWKALNVRRHKRRKR